MGFGVASTPQAVSAIVAIAPKTKTTIRWSSETLDGPTMLLAPFQSLHLVHRLLRLRAGRALASEREGELGIGLSLQQHALRFLAAAVVDERLGLGDLLLSELEVQRSLGDVLRTDFVGAAD